LATVFFAFQIYCDFSGYSDIAIGAAQVMGFDLMDNFKRPYFSKSIPEFWRRWHISLSTWFKDYVYIPLGGNRASETRYYANLFITFLISGLWHGAAWTFVIWGALHGFYQIFSLITKKYRVKVKESIGLVNYPNLNKYLQIGITFVLVDFAWIFFRANSLTDAWYIINNLFAGIVHQISSAGMLSDSLSGFGFSKYELAIAVGVILIMEAIHLIQRNGSIRYMMRDKPIWFRWSLYYVLVFMILSFGIYGKSEFLYFQF